MKCSEGMVFDETHSTCVVKDAECVNKNFPHEPEDIIEISEPDYDRILKCTHEGYFRNPYECHRFYRCFYNHYSEEHLRLATYICGHGKVFDEVSKNCIPAESAAECHNKQLPTPDEDPAQIHRL